jgi:4,5-dihydroxyphthalate decarboxylase
MTELSITLACRDYDHIRALRDGAVTIDGVRLHFIHVSPPSQIFLRMLRNEEFDASEMSLSNYMIALDRGDDRFVAIPVFPSRVFRHSYIWINANSGIQQPQDLRDKRLGIADYSMTALLFVRGLLKHEYGVGPEEILWFRSRSEHVAIETPPGIRIASIGKDRSLDDLFEAGELDAVALTSPPRGFRKPLPFIRRLFENSREVEADYYRRTRIFPIMHMVVIRRAVYERNPWLAAALTRGFQKAKEFAFERLGEALSPLPWINLDWEYAHNVMGADIYSYGVKRNLPTLEAATLYSYEQGLTRRKLEVSELFARETLDLLDEE